MAREGREGWRLRTSGLNADVHEVAPTAGDELACGPDSTRASAQVIVFPRRTMLPVARRRPIRGGVIVDPEVNGGV